LGSTLLFALSLLTKASGLFALPSAAALLWTQRRRGVVGCGDARWLAVWLGVALLYAMPQIAAFAHLGASDATFGGPWVHLRSIAAVGMRYVLMAATGHGVSAFQEPGPAVSWLEPYWLAAAPTAVLLVWRSVATLRRGRAEAACWVAAAAAFAPVSQLFPFLNPVADRYLYFILPGLIGGGLLWAQELLERPHRPWSSSGDAARHYPDGVSAHILRARSAAQAGDAETAVAALQLIADRGLDHFMGVRDDPGLAPLRDDPTFRQVIRAMAGRWIERARQRGYATQPELRVLGLAHLEREEHADAVAALEASLGVGGPLDAVVRAELVEARARLADSRGAQHPRPAP
jgi:hypothetical protein